MRKRRVQKNAQQLADEVVAEAANKVVDHSGQRRKQKRKRPVVPEETEGNEIEPADVRMADLVKDRRLGKTSQREAEMEKIDWAEVKKTRREADREAMREERKQNESRKSGRTLPAPGAHATERLVLVNGQMVVDESSRVIDRSAATARDADEHGEAINDDRLTARVNQATVGRKAGTRNYSVWDDEETEQFYQGLRMFGTDFMMISKMFPDTTRTVIKKKFSKEEKHNPSKVFTALNSKDHVDLEAFSAITNTTYEDPKDFYKELEEEQSKLEAEDAKIRTEEVQEYQDIQESIERREEEEGPQEATVEGSMPPNKSRLAEEAVKTIDAIGTSQRRKAKKTPSAKKKDGNKGRNLPAEGIEEVVGTIEDFDP